MLNNQWKNIQEDERKTTTNLDFLVDTPIKRCANFVSDTPHYPKEDDTIVSIDCDNWGELKETIIFMNNPIYYPEVERNLNITYDLNHMNGINLDKDTFIANSDITIRTIEGYMGQPEIEYTRAY